MSEIEFPQSVQEICQTLTELFRHQRKTVIVELLENARAYLDQIDYDNWNGGTYTWILRMAIPIPIFASLETQLPEIEKEIKEKLKYFDRVHPNHSLGDITISPITIGDHSLQQHAIPAEYDIHRLWPRSQFRLFISHSATHKIAVSQLKEQLGLRGIAAFVAHEDIEPSLEWRDEIELGLKSMHALVALMTPDFHASLWTDQEIGWALGRGVPVIPIRLGINPYGFAGKYQAPEGDLENSGTLAYSIVRILINNPKTHGDMRRSLVSGFYAAKSYAMAHAIRRLLVKMTDLSDEEKSVIRKACIENDQVFGAGGITEEIYKVFGRHSTNEGRVVPF